MTVQYDGLSVTWLGYATARIESADGFVGYTDPGRYGVLDDYWARDGDFVVVTHDHHYDPAGIRSVASEHATIVIYEAIDAETIDRDVESVTSLAAEYDVVRVDDEARIDVANHDAGGGSVSATIWSVAAYNDPKGPNADADEAVTHPPGSGCGYLLSIDDRTVFWPGDSDAIDGFAALDVDVFLANIGGGGIVSDRHAAADLAERLAPDLVVPIHYDTVPELEADGGAFTADVASRSIPVALDERSANQ